ncbi:helix-turn-helix transcriptional regulator [Clostridium magnum]|uniref:helix-turn-helix transcriptional regulator n=1 Tax=Clostridium magnum TaxID=33954 RepID=UPI003BFA6B47
MKNRLLEIRLKIGYKKQKDFAEFLDIATNQYSRYENNSVQPSVEQLCKISKKLKCTMEDLIIYEESN